MTKNRMGQVVASAFAVALLCGAGAARAQDQDFTSDGNTILSSSETVTVHPYNALHSSGPQVSAGRSGSLYSEELSMSRPVSYSDLDLTRVADARELRARISDTARDICDQLSVAGDPRMNDYDESHCINMAVRDAIRQVPGGLG